MHKFWISFFALLVFVLPAHAEVIGISSARAIAVALSYLEKQNINFDVSSYTKVNIERDVNGYRVILSDKEFKTDWISVDISNSFQVIDMRNPLSAE